MTKNWIIVLIALSLSACGTVATIPLDDAYYWPENTQTIQTTQVTPNTPNTPKAATIEYLNVQDTTVTIRVKR
ncbi:MAG: hypothetical protein IKS76_03495 [Paludibacteraceae bacterium]|nr:hypothetical protein [Paludibacteraceae bacterium]